MEEYLKFEREADRLEVLIIRPIYSFLIGIVLVIYGFIAEICLAIQWLIVLITGERNEGLNNNIKTFVEYMMQVYPYVVNLTDERPDLSHKRRNIFLEILEYGNNRKEYLLFEREADRLEVLIIRPIYSFLVGIVLVIYGFIAEICLAIQWLIVLITGERNEGLNNNIKTFVEYMMQVYPYVVNLTDERPDLSHKNMNVYIERLE